MGISAGQPTKVQGTDLRTMAELFQSLADETRLTILTMLLNGEMCVCEIMGTLPISQPAVSHHLKTLRQAGILIDRRQGKWIYISSPIPKSTKNRRRVTPPYRLLLVKEIPTKAQ